MTFKYVQFSHIKNNQTYKLPWLKQAEIDFLNRPINYEEIESVIKLQARTVFLENSTKHSKKK